MQRIRTILVFTALLASGLCYAPFKDPNKPKGTMPLPQTDALLEQQQKFAKVQGEVGSVPLNSNPQRSEALGGSANAAGNLNRAASAMDRERAQSASNLKNAKVGNSIPESKASNPWFALAWIFGGIALVLGLKHWVNKQVPEVPNLRSKA